MRRRYELTVRARVTNTAIRQKSFWTLAGALGYVKAHKEICPAIFQYSIKDTKKGSVENL